MYLESGGKQKEHLKQLCTKPIHGDESCFAANIMLGLKSVEESQVSWKKMYGTWFYLRLSRKSQEIIQCYFHACMYTWTSVWRHGELYDPMEINMVMNINMIINNRLKCVSRSWVSQEWTKCIVPTNPPQLQDRNEQHFVIIHSDIFSYIYCQKKYHFLELKERAANRNSYVISNCKHVFSSSFW